MNGISNIRGGVKRNFDVREVSTKDMVKVLQRLRCYFIVILVLDLIGNEYYYCRICLKCVMLYV